MTYRARLLDVLAQMAKALKARGLSREAKQLGLARQQVVARTTDQDSPYTIDLAAIDAVLAHEVTLGGELVQVLMDLAESHGPPLTQARDGRDLARALAVTIALPVNGDRAHLGDAMVDALAGAISREEGFGPPTRQEVLIEAGSLASAVDAQNAVDLVESLVQETSSQRSAPPESEHLSREVEERRSSDLAFGDILAWLGALMTVVVAVSAAVGAARAVVEEGRELLRDLGLVRKSSS